MSVITLVVAMSDNRVIGNKGTIPWYIADDMRHFRALTLGKPCIMGRKTWESLPRKPLPGRTNIVVTRNASFVPPGAVCASSLDAAVARAAEDCKEEICVIGGAEIYAGALPRAARIHLTQVHRAFAGDTHFPELESGSWHESAREDRETADGLRYSFITLERQE
jgi:dihydrofolate reductase